MITERANPRNHSICIKFCLVLLLMSQWHFLNAQSEKVVAIKHYTIEDGLPDTKCISGLVDSKGFLWVCTDYGLSKYNGHSFKNYTPDYASSTALKNTRVVGIIEKKDGTFWVLTNFCLYHFDASSEVFQQTTLCINTHNTGDIQFFKFFQQNENVLWISGKGGLFKFDINQNAYKRFPLRDDLTNARQHHLLNSIEVLVPSTDGKRLYVGNNPNFFFDLEKEIYLNCYNCPTGVRAIVEEKNKIWTASWGNGLSVYDMIDSSSETFFIKEAAPVVMADLMRKNDSILLVGTFYHGIWEFNKNSKSFTRMRYTEDHQYMQDVLYATKLYLDPQNNLYAFTWDGVIRINAENESIKRINISESTDSTIDKNMVIRSLTNITENEFIITTSRKNLILKYNAITQEFSKVEVIIDENHSSFGENSFFSYTDKTGKIWIANNFLYTYDPILNQVYSFEENQIKEKYGSLLIFDITEDRKGNILLGTANKGLIIYNSISNVFTQLIGTTDSDTIDSRARIQDVFINHKNIAFLRTDAYGIYKYDLEKQIWYPKIRTFYLDDQKLIKQLRITLEYRKDIYLSLYLGRALLVDQKGKVLRELVNNTGKPFSSIIDAHLLSDSTLVLLSTNGLYWMHNDFTVRAFQKEEGIRDLAGWSTSFQVTLDDRVFIGKKNSIFNLFRPHDMATNKNIPNVVLTGIEFLNADTTFGANIDYINDITLKYNQNFFTISFAALNLIKSERNQFRYLMDGLYSDWIENGNLNTATFTSLSPGNYTFKVMGSNNDGVWNQQPKELQINILPPWYQTMLAYIFYTFILGIIIYIVWNYYKRRWQLNNQLENERKEAERLKELDTIKNKIYTNITHEFRTPLTVISGLAKKIPGHESYTQKIETNSDHLLYLVNQMLLLSKMESGKVDLSMNQIDIIQYTNYIVDSFSSLANGKSISLNFYSNKDSLMLDTDVQKIKIILHNLISNAIKYTPKYGKILVLGEETGTHFDIVVSDTGNGISANEQSKIFDRFYQVDKNSAEGTGIGLSIVKELATALNGEIKVESEMGKGSKFIFSFPITNNAPLLSKMDLNKIPTNLNSIEKNELAIAHNSNSQKTILLIEDNQDVAFYLKEILKQKYHCLHSSDGKVGLKKAQEIIPDIIISDVMMPEMDGIEMSKLLKSDLRTSHIPIIIITAKSDHQGKLKGLSSGVAAYLQKPIDENELLVRIEAIIANQKLSEVYFATHFTPKSTTEVEDTFIIELVSFIKENLSEETFGIINFCRKLNLERTQVYRKIKGATGMSPTDLVQNLRLQKAQELLREDRLNISEIAFACGYKEASYFSKVFKKKFGMSPKDFREK